MLEMAESLRVLGDETRLRILRVLIEESLNVGELTQVLGLAQPTVSKHLSELKRAGLVDVIRRSGFNYYRIDGNSSNWWSAVSSSLTREEDAKGDLARLGEILKQRRELTETTDRFVVPGRSWVAWSRALRYLLPNIQVADFGCGDGAFSVEMAGWASEVHAIDSNPQFLAVAKEKGKDLANLHFRLEQMEQVSFSDESMDLVTISQSLHYSRSPLQVIREAHRVLRPMGRVLILDLLPHHEDWVKTELRHSWMGFPAKALNDWLAETGFKEIQTDTETRQSPAPFRIVIMTGTKEPS